MTVNTLMVPGVMVDCLPLFFHCRAGQKTVLIPATDQCYLIYENLNQLGCFEHALVITIERHQHIPQKVDV
jgi:hypothetical protein